MSRIEIFDIDGTICDSFFPNLNKKVDIPILKQKILNTPLFPGFVKYYKLIYWKKNTKTYFITGRRYKDFGSETKIQLRPLGQEQNIIFFPDNYSHSKIRYNIFKIYNILKIASAAKNVVAEINIYDDLCEYYPKLLMIAEKLGISNLNCHIVKDPIKFWELQLKELFFSENFIDLYFREYDWSIKQLKKEGSK